MSITKMPKFLTAPLPKNEQQRGEISRQRAELRDYLAGMPSEYFPCKSRGRHNYGDTDRQVWRIDGKSWLLGRKRVCQDCGYNEKHIVERATGGVLETYDREWPPDYRKPTGCADAYHGALPAAIFRAQWFVVVDGPDDPDEADRFAAYASATRFSRKALAARQGARRAG